jgi:hypothetical protein
MQCRLRDLEEMHPRLEWRIPALAAAAILSDRQKSSRFELDLRVESVPGFGTGRLQLNIDVSELRRTDIGKIRRFYQRPGLVEEAAIAVAGLALYYAGGHEIRDVAVHGAGADYLVDEENCLLEVSGRSQRRDVREAWQQRVRRLRRRAVDFFYVLCRRV